MVCDAFFVGVGDPDNPQIQQSCVGVIHESPEKMFSEKSDFVIGFGGRLIAAPTRYTVSSLFG